MNTYDRAGPVMAQFLGILRCAILSPAEIAARSGVDRSSILSWGIRSSPRVINFEAVINALGFRLVIVSEDEFQVRQGKETRS